MAQTVQYYYDQIRNEAIRLATDADRADVLSMLNNTSRVAIWKIFFYAIAFSCFLIDTLFDLFRAETDEKIKLLKPGTLFWYAEKIKTFQFGDDVIDETDVYDNTGLTEDEIEEKQVVKYAAAIEQTFSNGLFGIRLKLAGESGGERIQLPSDQLDAAKEFVDIFRYAGTYVETTSDDADHLRLSLRVYYNPLVLNNEGKRLDGTNDTPLQDAIDEHLKNLPFNGRFNLTALVDAMQAVDGVEDPRITSAMTKYAATNWTEVVDERIPDAGYLKIYEAEDLFIEWVPKNN